MSKIVKTVIVVAIAVAVVVFAPQIAAVLASVAGSLGVTVAATAISSALIGMGISMALTAAATLFRKAPSMSQSMADRLNTSVVPTASRKIIFGTTAGGQDVRFFEGDIDLPSTKKDGYVQVIALASHRINALKQFYVENDLVWQNGAFVSKREGFAANNPFRVVTEGKPGNGFAVGSGRFWNSASTFTGCAYYVPFWKLDEEVWESGIPQRLTAIVEGCPLYDPRRDGTRGGSGAHQVNDQNTYAFRDGAVEIGRNPALALLTYLLGWRINGKVVWGMGIPANRIDFDNFRAYANLCEEGVSTLSGTTVQRYTADGIFSTTDSHETVINGLTAAMGSCKLTDRGGTYCIVGGYDDTAGPKIAFDADDLVAPANGSSPYIWNPAPASRERFNIVRGRFANPEELYQLTDWGDPIEREPLADGIPRTMSIDLGAVSRAETCQRIAKQMLLREYLCPGMFSATFGPKAFAVEIGSVITLSLPAEGWNNKLFRVMEQAESHDLFFQMTLREEDPAIYGWDREEKPLPPTIRPQGYDASTTIAPANLALTSASYSGANGVNVSEVHVTWTPELSGRVNGIQIRSRPAGTDAWSAQAELFDPKIGMFTFTSNAPGIVVEVQARFRMMSAVYSPWVNASVATAEVVTITDWENVTDTTGTRPADNATVGAPIGSYVGSIPVADVVNKINALTTSGFTDNQAPPIPTGLAITSAITDNGANLSLTWNASTASDFAMYVVALKEGSGSFIEFQTTSPSYQFTGLPRNRAYTAKIAAVDKAGNKSGFSTQVGQSTAKDLIAPAIPTALGIATTYNGATLSWTNALDTDLATVEVWRGVTSDNASAVKIDAVNAVPGQPGRYIASGLTQATTYYFWLKSVDTSNNASPFTSPLSAVTAGGIVASDFVDGLAPITTVTALPTVAGYAGTPLVMFNRELYRIVNGAWSKEVQGSDIKTGTLPGAALVPTTFLPSTISVSNVVGANTIADAFTRADWLKVAGAGKPDDYATGGDNMLPNAALRTNTDGWTLLGQITRMVAAAGDPSNYFRATANNATPRSATFPIAAGTTKLFISYWKRSQLAGEQIAFDISFLNGAGGNAGYLRFNRFVGAADTWVQVKESVAVPTDAVTMYIAPVMVVSGTYNDLADIRLSGTENAATVGAPTGTMVGSTLSETIELRANDPATRVNQNTVTIDGAKLTAGTVTTNQLAAGSVTADRIATGAIVIGADGKLAGAGSGQVTIAGLGYTGDRDATRGAPAGTLVGSTPAQTLDTRVTSGLMFADTRNDNQPPSYYYAQYGTSRIVTDFKNLANIGLAVVGGYGGLTTSIQWGDPSGGPVHQEVRDSFGRYWNRVSTSTTTWGEWIDTGAQINSGVTTINGGKITTGSVTANQIAARTITANNLVSGTVTANEIAANTITSNQIAARSILAEDLAANSITANEIAANAITANRLAANSVTANAIVAGTVSAAHLAAGAVTATKLAIGNSDSVIPDSNFQDRAFWVNYNLPGIGLMATNGSWPAASVNLLQVTGSATVRDWVTPFFDMEPGATYRIRAYYWTDGSFSGSMNANIHMPGYQWLSLKTGIGATPDAADANAITAPTSGVVFKEITITNANIYDCRHWQFRFRAAFTGTFQFYASIVRVSDTTLIQDGAITTPKITVGSLNGDRIAANTLDANTIRASTVISNFVQVGGTGLGASFDLGSIALAANNPANRINAGTTTIQPGLVSIGSGATINNWKNGTDSTEIRGGAIAANTIRANSLQIGARGISVIGCDFQFLNNALRWSDGYILYTDDNGAPKSVTIPAGAVGWQNQLTYVFWKKDRPNLDVGVDWTIAQGNTDFITLCTWRGGASFVANYGGTIIDGDRITTNSIQASKLSVGSLSAISANVGSLRSADSGQRYEMDNNGYRYYDGAGTLRVKIGA